LASLLIAPPPSPLAALPPPSLSFAIALFSSLPIGLFEDAFSPSGFAVFEFSPLALAAALLEFSLAAAFALPPEDSSPDAAPSIAGSGDSPSPDELQETGPSASRIAAIAGSR
jgi:hypothetical protein